MSYMALYRKWRPDAFAEVKGQDHIVTTLKNQITHDRIGHAYLFCGTRGTGKTTIAKLFAKAVNCENPKEDGSPCNCCAMCEAITKGNSMNVIEIDAASNNGVDNIREIRDEVQYSPTEGKYKVYIIDEVHMLSIGAFNALLKTLEEPPSYVIFILATTESHKIPITILSRCQKYDFRRISIETIAKRLEDLLEREQIEYEDAAIQYIAKVADGSMRDGLSLLDQCIAFHLGECLTYDKVLDVLGAVDIEVFDKMLTHVLGQDVICAIDLLDEVMWQGRDLNQFVSDFTWYLRNLLLIGSSEQGIDKVDASTEHKQLLLAKAKQVSTETLMRYIRIFSEVSAGMRYAGQKRVALELAIIKLCKPQMETDLGSVLDRLRLVEEQLEKGVLVQADTSSQKAEANRAPAAADGLDAAEDAFDIEGALKEALPPATAEQIQQIARNWSKIKEKVGYPMQMYLDGVDLNLGEEADLLILCYPDAESFGYMYFSKEEHINQLQEAVSQVTGAAVRFQCRFRTNKRTQVTVHNYNLTKLNINVEYED